MPEMGKRVEVGGYPIPANLMSKSILFDPPTGCPIPSERMPDSVVQGFGVPQIPDSLGNVPFDPSHRIGHPAPAEKVRLMLWGMG